MSKWKNLRKDEGSAMVETAFSSIIVLAMLFGMFEGFFALYGYHYTSYAAREGARYAAVRGSACSTDSSTMPDCPADQANLTAYIKGLNYPGINASDITVTPTWYSTNLNIPTYPPVYTTCNQTATGCNDPGMLVQVKVEYKIPVPIPFINTLTFDMSSTSSMTITQ